MAGNVITNAIVKNRAKEGFEQIKYSLYDTVKVVAGANLLTFFQQTVGQVGIDKTNMKSSGMLPAGSTFICTEIEARLFNLDGSSLFLSPATTNVPYPINTIAAKGAFKFKYEPNSMYEGHLTELFETVHLMKDGAATALGVAALPNCGLYKTLKLGNFPIIIDSGRNFSFETTFTAPADTVGGFSATVATGTYMQIILKGILRRKA